MVKLDIKRKLNNTLDIHLLSERLGDIPITGSVLNDLNDEQTHTELVKQGYKRIQAYGADPLAGLYVRVTRKVVIHG